MACSSWDTKRAHFLPLGADRPLNFFENTMVIYLSWRKWVEDMKKFLLLFWVLAKLMASILLSWTYCGATKNQKKTACGSILVVLGGNQACITIWRDVSGKGFTQIMGDCHPQQSHLVHLSTEFPCTLRHHWIGDEGYQVEVEVSLSNSGEGQWWDKWDITSFGQWSFESTNSPNSMTPHPPALSGWNRCASAE